MKMRTLNQRRRRFNIYDPPYVIFTLRSGVQVCYPVKIHDVVGVAHILGPNKIERMSTNCRGRAQLQDWPGPWPDGMRAPQPSPPIVPARVNDSGATGRYSP
jgi:hypothetical protein